MRVEVIRILTVLGCFVLDTVSRLSAVSKLVQQLTVVFLVFGGLSQRSWNGMPSRGLNIGEFALCEIYVQVPSAPTSIIRSKRIAQEQ